MKKRFTLFKMVLLALMGVFLSDAQAAYPVAGHYYGCAYSNNGNNYPYYSSIEEVRIVDANNRVLYRKAPDGCNQATGIYPPYQWHAGDHYTVMNTKPAWTFVSGNSYTLQINGSNMQNNTIQMHIGIWIDVNGDEDYDDPGEFLGDYTSPCSSPNNPLPDLTSIKLNIPCGAKSVVTRMRIRSDYNTYAYNAGSHSTGVAGSGGDKGETEEYVIQMKLPSTLQAGFIMPDTAYVNGTVNMINSNPSGYKSHEWDINDDNSVEYGSTNATHQFASAGNFCVRLKSENCLGRDSVLKCITVIQPTAPPTIDFVAAFNDPIQYELVQMTDLSEGGPTYWEWEAYDSADRLGTLIDGSLDPNMAGSNPNIHRNPFVFFDYITDYTICMRAANVVGLSQWKCKYDYIKVQRSPDYAMDASTYNVFTSPITVPTGNITDPGGRFADYPDGEQYQRALIAPCGAEKIILEFSQMKIAANDYLRVFDGTDVGGKPLHPGDGFTSDHAVEDLEPLVATSGFMYLEFRTNNFGVASGFIGTWRSELGPPLAPVADFSVPDTLFTAVPMNFTNTSENAVAGADFQWTVDGVAVTGNRDMNYLFLSNKKYNVCLNVTTCAGTDQYCKTVEVVTPNTPTAIDFTADNRRPTAGEVVQIESMTDKANRFEWSVFPNTYKYVNGTDKNSQHPTISFNAAGPYTLTLKAWNYLDSANSFNKLIKDKFIIVVDYCTPIVTLGPSSDVSISSVMVKNGDDDEIFSNQHNDITSSYADLTTLVDPLEMTFGGKYSIDVERLTTGNMATRKVWIDFNIDGDFDDPDELVASDGPARDLILNGDFTVPPLNQGAFEGRTRMRVGISYSNDPNMSCGALSGVNGANRKGEYEDYSVVIYNENTQPVLTLKGMDTMYVQQGTNFVDPGAEAYDASQGDITDDILINNTVDINNLGIYFITYDVEDASGNMAPQIRRIVYVVKDRTAPMLSLNGPDTVRVQVLQPGTYYFESNYGATASDNEDGNITNAIVIDGEVDNEMVGDYWITYSVQDAQGNATMLQRLVIVEDQEKPVIKNNSIVVENGRNVVQVQIQSLFGDYTYVEDNYYNDIYGPQVQLNRVWGAAGEVDTRIRGTYPATYTATDGSGNDADVVEIDFVVEDFVAPNVFLNTDDTVLHTVHTPYQPVEVQVIDNYYNSTQISVQRTSTVNTNVLGLYKDEYTVTDLLQQHTNKCTAYLYSKYQCIGLIQR